MKEEFSQSVLEKIEQRGIAPKPRWRFIFHDVLLWFFWAIALLFGSITFSVIAFISINNSWILERFLRFSQVSILVEIIPFLWILAFVLFFGISYWNAIKTKHGYRFHMKIVLGNIFLSFLFGMMLYFFGMGHSVEKFVGKHIPPYRPFEERQEMMWTRPHEGFLGGIILSIEKENDFILRDSSSRIWLIKNNSGNREFVLIGNRVHVLGEEDLREGEYIFIAESIFPGKVRGSHFQFFQYPSGAPKRGCCHEILP
ncbi:MAG: hypothetical protein IPN70_03625 [Candidatus Moraniibacteriota bacterium]|nr:MAG: hypothetical protein IPN70_03625 [Candidatus Moranbacteria bacterium]